MLLRNRLQFSQNQYQQHRLIAKYDEVPTNTFPIPTSVCQQQLNLIATYFMQQQSQQVKEYFIFNFSSGFHYIIKKL